MLALSHDLRLSGENQRWSRRDTRESKWKLFVHDRRGKKTKTLPSPPLPLYTVIIEGDRRMRIDSWVGLVISFFLSSNLTIPVLPMRIAVLMTRSCFDRDPSSWKLDGSYKRNQEVIPPLPHHHHHLHTEDVPLVQFPESSTTNQFQNLRLW